MLSAERRAYSLITSRPRRQDLSTALISQRRSHLTKACAMKTATEKRLTTQGESLGGSGRFTGTAKKVPSVLGGKGVMIPLAERRLLIEWIDLAVSEGATLNKACGIIGLSTRTLQRWRATRRNPGRRPAYSLLHAGQHTVRSRTRAGHRHRQLRGV